MKYVPLGQLIEEVDQRNRKQDFSINEVKGINNKKCFIDTKANMDDVPLTNYKIVEKNWFCYVTVTSRNGGRVSLAFNQQSPCIVSASYTVFKVKEGVSLLPQYLYVFFNRPEFDRLTRFNSWGSAREIFTFTEMCRVTIPLPSRIEQEEVVNIYHQLQTLLTQQKALLNPIYTASNTLFSTCLKKYDTVPLGDYITEVNERNKDGRYGLEALKGVNNSGLFDDTKAMTDGLFFNNYKIVHKNYFAYNPARINIGSIALCYEEACIISPMYVVFKISSDKLLPSFLNLFFRRPEFQRSTLFFAEGSVRDIFDFDAMCRVSIPLPPLPVQEEIAHLQDQVNECRRIMDAIDTTMHTLCPALIAKLTQQ